MAISYNNTLLINTGFDDEQKVFILSDENEDYIFNIPYVAKLEAEIYNPDDYYLFLFENNHLNAENDCFQLYDENDDKRIGWVFPISVLDSNENDYAENVHLNKYKFVAFKKLLSRSFSYRINLVSNEINSISDIFGENTFIVILSKELINKDDFNISSFYPSLATYGYYLKSNNRLSITSPINYLVNKFRGRKKLYLKYTNSVILSVDFMVKLYEIYLKELDHHLIRFHLLYQVIEYLITNKFSSEFESLLQKYNDNLITKNNFIEEINNIRNERKNIRNIFEQLHFNDGSFAKEVKIDLERDAKDFIREFNIDENKSLGDLIYDIRNIIVHNYREVKNENHELLDKITYEFEILVNYLIMNSP